MDPLEAGHQVLNGIRNNDLYIFSNPEYEQVVRDRNDALLASIAGQKSVPPKVRADLACAMRNVIYADQVRRRAD